ncbi:MAG: hypothetical protein WCF57_00500 [Pyrinomonadaceae bacterium]
MISIYLVKRALPFILTLIFGTGLGSIFGGSHSQRIKVAPNYAPAHSSTYQCPSRRRQLENRTPSQNGLEPTAMPRRSDPTLISR